jgi:hypothetical protein
MWILLLRRIKKGVNIWLHTSISSIYTTERMHTTSYHVSEIRKARFEFITILKIFGLFARINMMAESRVKGLEFKYFVFCILYFVYLILILI